MTKTQWAVAKINPRTNRYMGTLHDRYQSENAAKNAANILNGTESKKGFVFIAVCVTPLKERDDL